jgi:transcriptional regulator GlxA family with amidase domain
VASIESSPRSSAAAIAAELGFTEATNFGKFFARHPGTSQARFRVVAR